MAEIKDLPKENGWYWIDITLGYPIPCSFHRNESDLESSYFLPAGLGDSSSSGLYLDDIRAIGPEIIEPKF